DKPYSVADAIADYLREAKLDGRYTGSEESFCRTRILPQLGEIEVGKLTKKKLKDWQRELAESPRRKTGRGTSEARDEWAEPPTEKQQKSRKATANRVLTILKRALNVAAEDGRYTGPTMPWRDVKPFKGSGSPRVRFLSLEEQSRLLNACPPDFRALVQAALYTGSRYSPLCRLKVGDFNAQAGTVWIEKDKGKNGGKSRHVALGPKAIEWFTKVTAGRNSGELMFTRASANRTLRKEAGNQWLPYDSKAFMDHACEAAKIERIVFHELRHTYASSLVNQGVALSFVAAQLGHASTRMVEKYYGHLAPNALAAAIRQAEEPDAVGEGFEVVPLKIKISG
ncbi:MAG TPA: tyrosine-type recombinase/integrase, partial [Holophaga sp.]|nr:tyrosine-type recombinase/integrase [Holophaga sp.]